MSTAISSPGIVGVGQIQVNAKDLQQSVAFYRDVLGLRLLMEIPGAAFFDAGNLRLMVARAETPEFDHPASIIYYRVPDLTAAFQAVRAAGATVAHEPHMIARMPDHELWMAFVRDPAENYVGLMAEVR